MAKTTIGEERVKRLFKICIKPEMARKNNDVHPRFLPEIRSKLIPEKKEIKNDSGAFILRDETITSTRRKLICKKEKPIKLKKKAENRKNQYATVKNLKEKRSPSQNKKAIIQLFPSEKYQICPAQLW